MGQRGVCKLTGQTQGLMKGLEIGVITSCPLHFLPGEWLQGRTLCVEKKNAFIFVNEAQRFHEGHFQLYHGFISMECAIREAFQNCHLPLSIYTDYCLQVLCPESAEYESCGHTSVCVRERQGRTANFSCALVIFPPIFLERIS